MIIVTKNNCNNKMMKIRYTAPLADVVLRERKDMIIIGMQITITNNILILVIVIVIVIYRQ